MPELPEVETIVRSLRNDVIGRSIVDINNYWPRHISMPPFEELRRRITGTTIDELNRRGKYLVFGLDSGESLIIHLKMTGQLLLEQSGTATPEHVHTVILLSGDLEIRFRDVRKFGRVYLTPDSSEILGKLGPEPLSTSFTSELLHSMLQNRRRVLKPLMLDQSFIAGIGNIYADESLHLAEIEPHRISNTLTREESRVLHTSIRHILERAIENGGATISDYRQPDGSTGEMQRSFSVYGRSGEVCYRCTGVIERTILGGRSTYYCRSCQR